MRSKRPLKPGATPNPFSDWDREGERLGRRSVPGTTPAENEHPAAPRTPSRALRHEPAGRQVLWDRMVVGWLLLGIKAGTVVGALLGLFAGPAGFFIGAIVGAFAGGFLAVPVLLQALLIYGIRHVAGRPPRTTGQHIRIFLTLPAVLLAIPLLFSPESAIVTGPPLATGLVFGPHVVRNALRPVLPARSTPPDVLDDSPQEVTS